MTRKIRKCMRNATRYDKIRQDTNLPASAPMSCAKTMASLAFSVAWQDHARSTTSVAMLNVWRCLVMFGDTGKVAAALSAANYILRVLLSKIAKVVVYQFAIVTVITVDADQKVHQHF